jgi:hypothetical protein
VFRARNSGARCPRPRECTPTELRTPHTSTPAGFRRRSAASEDAATRAPHRRSSRWPARASR